MDGGGFCFRWAVENYFHGHADLLIRDERSLSTELAQQYRKFNEGPCKLKGQEYSNTRNYILNELGVEVFVKMKKNIKTTTSFAKIKFLNGSYDDKVFGVMKKYFLIHDDIQGYRFDNVYKKKGEEKEYLIKYKKLIENRPFSNIKPSFSSDYYYIDPKFEF